VIGLPCTFLFKNSPDEVGMNVDGLTPQQVQALQEAEPRRYQSTEIDFTAREALYTRAFWMISLGHGTALLVVGAVIVHLVAHLSEPSGHDYNSTVVAGVILLMTVCQIVGQLVGGYLGDLFSKRLLCIACMLMHGLGLFLVAYFGSPIAVVAFAVLHGVAWGTRGPLMSAMRAD